MRGRDVSDLAFSRQEYILFLAVIDGVTKNGQRSDFNSYPRSFVVMISAGMLVILSHSDTFSYETASMRTDSRLNCDRVIFVQHVEDLF